MVRTIRGVTATPFLIILSIVMIVCGLLAALANNAKSTAERQIVELQGQIETLEREKRANVEKLVALSKAIGYGGSETQMAEPGTIASELTRVNDNEIQPKVEGETLHAQRVIEELVKNLKAARGEAESRKNERDKLKQDVKDAETRKDQELGVAQTANNTLRTEKAAIQDRFDKRVKLDEETQANLKQQLDATRANLEQEQKGHEEDVKKWKSEVSLLKTRVTELTQVEERQTTEVPDGQVIRGLERDFDPSGQGYAYIYIDIGRTHGVRAGTKFAVYSLGKGGRRTEKGTLVVKQALDDTAECGILDQRDDRNPIVRGDFVENRFFEKNVKKVFTTVGAFDGQLTRYTKGDWAKIVGEHGHLYEERITPRTNYVILGDKHEEDPTWKTAQLFKVEPVKEDEVLAWFDYGAYTPREGKVGMAGR